MINYYKYTETELKSILKSMVILYDSREQENSHILAWYDNKKIPYKKSKMDAGDYSFYIPANLELSIHRDIYFTDIISIERKASVDEIIGNFSADRNRIEDEFLRHKGKLILMIEDTKYSDIYEGRYKGGYNSKSAIGTLHSFSLRYNVDFIFMEKDYAAKFIFCTFYYFLREFLLNKK